MSHVTGDPYLWHVKDPVHVTENNVVYSHVIGNSSYRVSASAEQLSEWPFSREFQVLKISIPGTSGISTGHFPMCMNDLEIGLQDDSCVTSHHMAAGVP